MTKWHEAILSKLDRYTGFDIDSDDDHIIVSCKNAESFDVSLHAFGSEFQVSFDGWHERFEAEEEALKNLCIWLFTRVPPKGNKTWRDGMQLDCSGFATWHLGQ